MTVRLTPWRGQPFDSLEPSEIDLSTIICAGYQPLHAGCGDRAWIGTGAGVRNGELSDLRELFPELHLRDAEVL